MNRRDFLSAAALLVPAAIGVRLHAQQPNQPNVQPPTVGPTPQPKGDEFTLVFDTPAPYDYTSFYHPRDRMSDSEASQVRQSMSRLDFDAGEMDFSNASWDVVGFSEVYFRLYVKEQVGVAHGPVRDVFAYIMDTKRPPIQLETFDGPLGSPLLHTRKLRLTRVSSLTDYPIRFFDFQVLETCPAKRLG